MTTGSGSRGVRGLRELPAAAGVGKGRLSRIERAGGHAAVDVLVRIAVAPRTHHVDPPLTVTHTFVGHPCDRVRVARPGTVDFDSTTAGYTSACTPGARACGTLEKAAPPGSPVPVGRFRAPVYPGPRGGE